MAKRPNPAKNKKKRDIALFTGARRALARERPADLKLL
jgi:hypothetical protein